MPDKPMFNYRVFLALHSSFPHAASGYAVRSHSIATHLQGHGVPLDVYTRPGFPFPKRGQDFSPAPPVDKVDEIIYHRLPTIAPEIGAGGEWYRKMAKNIFAKAIRNCGSTIVHAASDLDNGLPAVLAGKECGCKTVYEYRGMWHYTRNSFVPWFFSSEDYAERHRLEISVGQEADAVLSISETLKADLIANGIEASKITVVPNAVDMRRFAPLQPDKSLVDELGLNGRKVVGFVGSVTPYEGLDYLIDAVLSLNAAGEKVSLIIVGDGGHVEALKEHHKARGEHQSIIFTGRVPYTDVQRYYSIIDIIALPRINAKVCQCIPPLKPLEAMAMRKALVVSDLPVMREMVKDNDTGLICQPENPASLAGQLGKLISDHNLHKQLTDNAFEWVQAERDWKKISSFIIDSYEHLMV